MIYICFSVACSAVQVKGANGKKKKSEQNVFQHLVYKYTNKHSLFICRVLRYQQHLSSILFQQGKIQIYHYQLYFRIEALSSIQLYLLYHMSIYNIIIIMNIRDYLIFAFLIVCLAEEVEKSSASQMKKLCKYSLNQIEWLQEQTANNLYVNQARKTFKTPSKSLIRRFIQYKRAENRQNQKQQYYEHVAKIKPQVQQYTAIYKYWLLMLAVVFLYYVFKIFTKHYNKSPFSCSLANLKLIYKIVKICLIVCIALSMYFSIGGYKEGDKTQKSLATLMCKAFSQPRGLVKGGSGPQYDGYQAYIAQVQKYLHKFTINFESIRYLIKNKPIINEIVRFGRQIMAITKDNNQSFSQEMNRTVSKLSQIDLKLSDIKQSLWHNKTVEQSREAVIVLQYQLKTVQNYSKKKLLATNTIKYIKLIFQLFYASIGIVLLVIICGLLLKNAKFIPSKVIVQFMLVIFIIICLSSAYLASYAVPGIVWLSPIVDYISQSENNIRDELYGTKMDQIQILTRFIPKTSRDFTSIYQNHLMKNLTQFDQMIQPYYQVDQNYLDQLFQTGAKLTESAGVDTLRIHFLLKKNLTKQILNNLKVSKQGIKEILSTASQKGQLTAINPSAIGNYFRQTYDAIRVPLFNRIYNARWNCNTIGFLLLIILISLILLQDIKGWIYSKEEFSKIQKGHSVESQELINSIN